MSLFAAIINKLKDRMDAEVPRIFEATFESTLQVPCATEPATQPPAPPPPMPTTSPPLVVFLVTHAADACRALAHGGAAAGGGS